MTTLRSTRAGMAAFGVAAASVLVSRLEFRLMADNRIVHRRRDAAAVVSKAFAAIVALAALVFGAERAAAAPILLEIDATNPNAVVFTATSAASMVSRSGQGEAIRLVGSLMASSRFAALTSGDFTAAESNYRYGILSGSDGLRLTCCGNQTQTFVAGQRAFFGSSVFDLEPSFSLVTSNSIGDIMISDNNGRDTGIVLGQYRLTVTAPVPVPVPVPVPPSLALVVCGLALMGFALRRRRAA